MALHLNFSLCNVTNLYTVLATSSTEDSKIPTSLGYHLADIYNEELEKAMKASPEVQPFASTRARYSERLYIVDAGTPRNAYHTFLPTQCFVPITYHPYSASFRPLYPSIFRSIATLSKVGLAKLSAYYPYTAFYSLRRRSTEEKESSHRASRSTICSAHQEFSFNSGSCSTGRGGGGN